MYLRPFYSFAIFILLASCTVAVPIAIKVPSFMKPKTPSAKVGGTPASIGTIKLCLKTYTLESVLEPGQVGTAYLIVGSSKVAKRFSKQQQVIYKTEVKNTKKVLGSSKVNTGESQISKTGDKFYWIITPRVEGVHFLKNPGFQAMQAKENSLCKAYLKNTVRPEFVSKLTQLHKSSGLVHLDAHKKNTFWDSQAKVITGFIDFDQMDVVDGPKYKQKVQYLSGNHLNTAPLDRLAGLFAMRYYPDILCTRGAASAYQ